MSGQHPDQGFTLVEVLLVITVLGLLGAIVVASVGGMKADADTTTCAGDARTLETAAEAYFAQHRAGSLPAASADLNGYEQTLVEADLLRTSSQLYDLDGDGALVVAPGSRCALPS